MTGRQRMFPRARCIVRRTAFSPDDLRERSHPLPDRHPRHALGRGRTRHLAGPPAAAAQLCRRGRHPAAGPPARAGRAPAARRARLFAPGPGAISAVRGAQPPLGPAAPHGAGDRRRARLRDQRRARRAAVDQPALRPPCRRPQPAGAALHQSVGLRDHQSLEPRRAGPEPAVQGRAAPPPSRPWPWPASPRTCARRSTCMSTSTRPPTPTTASSTPPRPRATARRFDWNPIPDGFYLVGDTERPVPAFQRALIAAVRTCDPHRGARRTRLHHRRDRCSSPA